MALYLTVGAAIAIICVVFNKISNKIGVPMLFAFILLGMLFGSDGLFKYVLRTLNLLRKYVRLSLIFIIFYRRFRN